MYCADCGGKMYVHRTYNGKRDPQFTCSQYTKVPCGTLCGTQHRIRAEAVLTLITDMLRAIAEYSKNDRAEFIRTVQETQAAQQTADRSKKRKRLAAAQKRAGELEKLICNCLLYTSWNTARLQGGKSRPYTFAQTVCCPAPSGASRRRCV